MKKYIIPIVIIICCLTGVDILRHYTNKQFIAGSVSVQNFDNIQPFTDQTYNNGASSLAWLNTFTKGLTLSTTTAGCATISGTGILYSTASPCGGSSPTFAPNSIITSNPSGSLIATSSQLTVGNIIATTTAESYFLGNVAFGTTTPANEAITLNAGKEIQLWGLNNQNFLDFRTTDTTATIEFAQHLLADDVITLAANHMTYGGEIDLPNTIGGLSIQGHFVLNGPLYSIDVNSNGGTAKAGSLFLASAPGIETSVGFAEHFVANRGALGFIGGNSTLEYVPNATVVTGGTPAWVTTVGGFFGIGTTTPSQVLDVNGGINIESSTTPIILHDDANGLCYKLTSHNGVLTETLNACR